MATIEAVRAVALRLPRSYEVLVGGRVKFRVGRLVYLAFSADEGLMGFAFPKEMRAALVRSEAQKFLMPRTSDLRYNWVRVRLAAIDDEEMRAIVVDAWTMVVPKGVAADYLIELRDASLTAVPCASMTGMAPDEQSFDPVALLRQSTARTLELAATWLAWDGRPRLSEDGDRLYTPNKAIRRSVDHLVDHLAQVQAVLAGERTEPDGWYGSIITLASDWAPFTEADLVEAQQRLRRITETFVSVLTVAGPAEWTRARDQSWTLKEIVEHVASSWYAEQVGDLRVAARSEPSSKAAGPDVAAL